MKPLLKAFLGKNFQGGVPVWLMRQAGRYLPEYLEIRGRKGGFLDLVYCPELASEVSMQPIRRFGLDGAIIFSDILVIPQALGLDVKFDKNSGPVVETVDFSSDLKSIRKRYDESKLDPVYEAISNLKNKLDKESFEDTCLIGFSGAPWTLACYMTQKGKDRDFTDTRFVAYNDPENFQLLIRIIEDAVIRHLSRQIDAGAEVLQLFDSWSGILDGYKFRKWVINPTARIVKEVKRNYPDVPIIGFPKGAGIRYPDYQKETGVDAVSVDSSIDPAWIKNYLQSNGCVQGNLDPVHLLSGKVSMIEEIDRIMKNLSDGPFIFNLGHGINKNTPIKNVYKLCEEVRAWGK